MSLIDIFKKYWFDSQIVTHDNIYYPEHLEAFVAIDSHNTIKGLLTFIKRDNDLEIVTLDSFEQHQGLGSRLLESAEQKAIEQHCNRLWLITTNDNLNALGFYQRRGFQITAIFPNAVNKARKSKPSIPLKAENGIPIRDELRLKKKVDF